MKKSICFLLILVFTLSFSTVFAQKMDNEKLEAILSVVSDSITGQNGAWQFKINDRMFMCITDESHNRMRIMTPITKQEELKSNELSRLLEANFHTALDVKYALSNKILWSVFIHPLNELSTLQVKDAVSQVYYAAVTYGTIYSSTDMVFPSSKDAIIDKKNDSNEPTEKVIDIDLLRKKN